jgi:DNA modification methylase
VLFHQDETVTLHRGHTLEVLRELPESSVQCAVTSPPYWGLRDYGLPPAIWGGDQTCDHDWSADISAAKKDRQHLVELGVKLGCLGGNKHSESADKFSKSHGAFCGKCHAWRGCFGLEPTPQLYIEHAVEIFREVRRVLRNDGTLWLNIGDSYANDGKWGGTTGGKHAKGLHGADGLGRGKRDTGLKPKDLCGIPWRVALALQADGWYLRQDIIWHKPSCMPSSVNDRCTTAHEYLFLLTKSARYYFDAEAIKEPAVTAGQSIKMADGWDTGPGGHGSFHRNGRQKGERDTGTQSQTRNRRSVWTIATRPYKGAHFATFPPQLVEPCILSGTSENGCCQLCGAPWKRQTERQVIRRERPSDKTSRHNTDDAGVNSCGNTVAGVSVVTTGWEPRCRCVFLPEAPHGPVPCTVLDPFIGSGTTCMVANWLGRKSIGIDQSETYLRDHALSRIRTPRAKAKRKPVRKPSDNLSLPLLEATHVRDEKPVHH